MADNRTFTDDEEPPFGERITLRNPEGIEIVWNGKRWFEQGYERSLSMHEAWPPSNQSYVGPWFESGGGYPMSTDTLKVTDVLDTLARILAGDPRDWSLDRRDAWLWGVLCGWECEDHPDTIECDETCTNALASVAARHGWNAVEVNVLRGLRATVREARNV